MADGFIRDLAQNPKTPTRDLLHPHLQREAELRRAFARGDSGIQKLANLVPFFTQDGHVHRLQTRTIDRELSRDGKYMMRLPSSKLQPEHQLATVPSLDDYKRNFEAFTHSMTCQA